MNIITRKSFWVPFGETAMIDPEFEEMQEGIQRVASVEDIATPRAKHRNTHYELVKWNHLFRDDVTSRYLEA